MRLNANGQPMTWVQEFEEAHGVGQSVEVRGWLVYPDGAMREPGPYGASREPPEDDYERWKTIVSYHETLLTQATDQHHEIFQNVRSTAAMAAARGQQVCTEDEFDEIERLVALVKKRRRELKKAVAKVEASTPSEVREQAVRKAASSASRAKYNAEAIARLEKLRI